MRQRLRQGQRLYRWPDLLKLKAGRSPCATEHKTTQISLTPMNNRIQICSPKWLHTSLHMSVHTVLSVWRTQGYPDHRSSFTFEVQTLPFAFEVAYRNYLRPFCASTYTPANSSVWVYSWAFWEARGQGFIRN